MAIIKHGVMSDSKTIILDTPVSSDEREILVKIVNGGKRTKLQASEEFILSIAERDIEEIY